MLLNSHTFQEGCSDADSESDNFSVDSLDNEKVSSKNPKDNTSTGIHHNYGYNKTNLCELPFDSENEPLVEARISKVDIILPSVPYAKENEKTKFEKKTVMKVCQHRRTQSMSRSRNIKDNQASSKEIVRIKSQVSSNYFPRSLSSDSASLQAHFSQRSPVRKAVAKSTPTNKPNKRNISYLVEYREANPHYQAQGSDDNDMKESPSQVSVITSQGDESQLYSDIINGKISEWGQSESENDAPDRELTSASVQDLKSVSEIQSDSNHGRGYVPYTVKDRLLVMPTKLGSLGPDPSSYREKAESCKKRQQYGIFASLKNMEIIRQRNLKKMISEAITDLHESTSQDDMRADNIWECCSSSHSSSSSKVEVHEDDISTSSERSKKLPIHGCRTFKKKPPPTDNDHNSEKGIVDRKNESNLHLINKLLRDRNKNELIINKF